MSKKKYILIRSIHSLILMWLAITFLFFFFRLLPGDYASVMLLQGADAAAVEAFREKWGLNDPLYIQYFDFLINLTQGDVGDSLRYRVPVVEFVKMRIFNSLVLLVPAITVAYILGAIIGTFQAINRESRFDRFSVALIIFVGAHPSFYVAILLIVIFAGFFDLFPTGNMVSPTTLREAQTWYGSYLTLDFLHHYILPFSAVTFRFVYYPSLIMRTSVVETLGQDFINYHRITEISKINRLKSLMKHSSLPLITLYPISLTQAIGGVVLIEIVFNWPGIGFALVNAVTNRDIPVVQFIFFLMIIFIIMANFLIDLIYSVVDPRITLE